MEKIWKEAFIAILKNFPVIFFEGLKTTTKNSVSTTDIPAVIRTEYLPDANPKRYVYATRAVANIIEMQLQTKKATGFCSINRLVGKEGSNEDYPEFSLS